MCGVVFEWTSVEMEKSLDVAEFYFVLEYLLIYIEVTHKRIAMVQ